MKTIKITNLLDEPNNCVNFVEILNKQLNLITKNIEIRLNNTKYIKNHSKKNHKKNISRNVFNFVIFDDYNTLYNYFDISYDKDIDDNTSDSSHNENTNYIADCFIKIVYKRNKSKNRTNLLDFSEYQKIFKNLIDITDIIKINENIAETFNTYQNIVKNPITVYYKELFVCVYILSFRFIGITPLLINNYKKEKCIIFVKNLISRLPLNVSFIKNNINSNNYSACKNEKDEAKNKDFSLYLDFIKKNTQSISFYVSHKIINKNGVYELYDTIKNIEKNKEYLKLFNNVDYSSYNAKINQSKCIKYMSNINKKNIANYDYGILYKYEKNYYLAVDYYNFDVYLYNLLKLNILLEFKNILLNILKDNKNVSEDYVNSLIVLFCENVFTTYHANKFSELILKYLSHAKSRDNTNKKDKNTIYKFKDAFKIFENINFGDYRDGLVKEMLKFLSK